MLGTANDVVTSQAMAQRALDYSTACMEKCHTPTAACLGDGDAVTSAHDDGQRLGLDGQGLVVAAQAKDIKHLHKTDVYMEGMCACLHMLDAMHAWYGTQAKVYKWAAKI